MILSLVVIAGGVVGAMYLNNSRIASTFAQNQKNDANTKRKIAKNSDRPTGEFAGNLDIPSASQLKKYRAQPDKLVFLGYFAVPVQNGVKVPIKTVQVNEGGLTVSQENKVLAVGAGTGKAGQIMGQGNYTLVGHNVYGFGGKAMFTPLQNKDLFNVNKQPKAYLTDGKFIYTYQINPENNDPSGRKIVPASKGGYVMNDNQAKNGAILTLITCDEPNVWTSNPANRIVITGSLVNKESFNNASNNEKSLFPAYNH